MTATPGEGGCRCGQVRFRALGPPLVTMACHCRGCQRMTGSAFSLSALHPSAAFEVTAGEPVIGGLHGPSRHLFCPHCLSWLFTRPEGLDDFVNVRMSLFDEVDPDPPYLETMTGSKLPWAVTGAAHSFEGFPPPESFPVLLADFAQRRGEGPPP